MKLRLPSIVGYLVAGVVVGPFTPGYVANTHLAPQLAEIGIILLMFGVGMHFSLRDLLAVKNIAVFGAILQIAISAGATFVLTHFWRWNLGASLVMGIALSIASTVVFIRELEEHDLVATADGRIAVGWLVVEDLFTVLVLVLLPGVAAVLGHHAGQAGSSGHPILGTLAITLAKVAAFIGLMLVIGRRILPWSLERIVRTGSRELFTLGVTAAAVGIAFGASELFGVSFALGAFLAGLVISTSDHGHQATESLKSLQDVFSVLFFVSVGMLFDPAILWHRPLSILAITGVIVLVKPIATFLIVRMMGYPGSTALLLAAGLGQIGEFSFILAALGIELGLLPTEGENLILGGAIASIAVNALLFKFALRAGSAGPVLETVGAL